MQKLALFTIMIGFSLMASAQTGYNIPVTVKPFKNQYVYLAYHYGKVKALADSVLLDANSKGVLKGKEKLPGGIYFIVSPNKAILFELLLDKQQNFSIAADSATLPQGVVFTGSQDNTLFRDYSLFINKTGTELNNQTKLLSTAGNKADSAAIQTKIRALSKEMQQYRNDLEKKNPNSILTVLFKAIKEPVIPEGKLHPGGKYDSTYAYYYFKNHYWDGVSFTDERVLRTPIFEGKLEHYYRSLVSPVPDSLIKEWDNMLSKAKSNKTMYQYLLTYAVQKYINPEYMGQDAVYVHLFEKYINEQPVDWFTEKYRKYMRDRAYSLMANLIGKPAQDLVMTDTLEKTVTLYNIQAPFTVICFWDATCSHCKEMVPHLDSMFQHKWKALGVKLMGVMVDGGKEAWLKYIAENNLKDWIHVYQTDAQRDADMNAGKPSYKQLYDAFQAPTLFLLDDQKRIIAKKLTYDQIDEVIKQKLKK